MEKPGIGVPGFIGRPTRAAAWSDHQRFPSKAAALSTEKRSFSEQVRLSLDEATPLAGSSMGARTMLEIALDEWRPGFAKRYNNFQKLVDVARNWRWEPGQSIERARSLVAVATPDLTDGERTTLQQLLECVNRERLEKNSDAFVFPSSRLLSWQLGYSESVVRSRRASLEKLGYIVRDYDKANRPAGVEAVSLAPLFARLDELEARRAEVTARNKAYHEALREKVVDISNYSAMAPDIRRLEQSQNNFSSSAVQESAAPSARSDFEGRATPEEAVTSRPRRPTADGHRKLGAIGSPKRARDFGREPTGPSSLAKTVKEELAMAVQVCPDLSGILTAEVLEDPSNASYGACAELEAIATRLLPEGERNNALTVRWGWERHGVRAAAMLAIALKDPRVANPCRYFGKLATSPATGQLDLRLNLMRARKWQKLAPAEPDAPLPNHWPSPPGKDHPTWVAIAEVLAQHIRRGSFDTWFAPSVGFVSLEDGVLTIAANPTAAERIGAEFRTHVLLAAEEAGFTVSSLVVQSRGLLR